MTFHHTGFGGANGMSFPGPGMRAADFNMPPGQATTDAHSLVVRYGVARRIEKWWDEGMKRFYLAPLLVLGCVACSDQSDVKKGVRSAEKATQGAVAKTADAAEKAAEHASDAVDKVKKATEKPMEQIEKAGKKVSAEAKKAVHTAAVKTEEAARKLNYATNE
jgi:hypothetical protein